MVGCDTSTIFYSATCTIPRKQVASLASSVLDKISAVLDPLGTNGKARNPQFSICMDLWAMCMS